MIEPDGININPRHARIGPGITPIQPGSVIALRFFVVIIFTVCMNVVDASAEWRIDIESTTVNPGETGVTLDITAYWDLTLLGLTIPVAVREIDPGAFWTGTLPYDTLGNAASHPFVHGVTWNWDSPWAFLAEDVTPAWNIMPGHQCNPPADTQYDGVSPDHFVVNVLGALSGTPPEPLGRPIITLTFDVADIEGQFEFDTACFSASLSTVLMIDDQMPVVDHGPTGTGEFTFNKGIITVQESSGILETDGAVPGAFTLRQNYPNPFNTNTLIEFSLAEDSHLTLEIFDILGRKITTLVDGFTSAGRHLARWSGKNDWGESVGSGVYFCRLTTGARSELKTMVLLK